MAEVVPKLNRDALGCEGPVAEARAGVAAGTGKLKLNGTCLPSLPEPAAGPAQHLS